MDASALVTLSSCAFVSVVPAAGCRFFWALASTCAPRRSSTLQRFDLRQLLFQSAQVIFGSLVWRSAHNHALDQAFLLRDQSFQFFQAFDVVRHSRQRLALRACSLNAISA